MKAKWILFLGLGLLAIPARAQDSSAPTTQKDKVSYGIGVQVAKTLKGQGVEALVSLNPTQLKFVEHFGSQAPPQTVTLTNTGTGDLTVTGVRADPTFFTIRQEGCTGHAITPGSTCSITVGYYFPATNTSIAGALMITDNARPGSQSVGLQGTTLFP